MILEFAQWLQATALFTGLRGSAYLYPVVLSLHMVIIAFFGGMVLLTNLRLLGLSMSRYPAGAMLERFRLPKRYALIAMLVLGFLLFGCKAEEYYYNVWFRAKLILLLLIGVNYLIFRGSIYNNTAALDRAVPSSAKLAAALSLILWAGVVCAGRGIGYIEPPLDKIHAGLHSAPHAALYSRSGVRRLV